MAVIFVSNIPDGYVPAVPDVRPAMTGAAAELHDRWLRPNGISGWLPERSTITVKDRQITYPAWRHSDGTLGGWGQDVMVVSDTWTPEQRERALHSPGGLPDEAYQPLTVERTVPLVVPVTDRIRELAASVGVELVDGDAAQPIK